MAIVRKFSALTAATVVVAAGLVASGCSTTKETSSTTTTEASAATTTTAAETTTAAATTAKPADVKSLVPTPANTAETKGPDAIANDGVHLHFQVNGAPKEVMDAFKIDLEGKGWDVTTIVTSDNGGGGGATYTGTNGAAYGVFDGGGYDNKTYLDVCTWPTKPADPNCARGER
ncbi:MAG: hypothetical protein U0Q20_11690 [Mycobacterium sp.]|nr:hypothetical protein [Mycobacterium sp.]